jgi:hypothetical protein
MVACDSERVLEDESAFMRSMLQALRIRCGAAAS